ncbi:cubilin-like [Procambarus clarkii]|uniref:cubilin n=1 Tax=Procambarus clarkii TaxID=6728 RepID=UPI001E673C90|nr:cubilin-like [Procambarus clarkii]
MITQVVVAVMVVWGALAWPITPAPNDLSNDRVSEQASCGGRGKVMLEVTQVLEVTFSSDGQVSDLGDLCTYTLRVAFKGVGLKKYGIRVAGHVALDDGTNDPNCSNSFLSLVDADDLTYDKAKKQRYCKKAKVSYETKSDVVVLKLNLRDIAHKKGELHLQITSEFVCGGLVDFEGTLSTPYYPSLYPADIVCLWRIRAPKGFIISLDFAEFDLRPQKGSQCKDYVNIEFVKKFCGRQLENVSQTYNSEDIFMTFQSSQLENNEYVGFTCNVTFQRTTWDF